MIMKDPDTRSLLSRTFVIIGLYLAVTISLFGTILWYGRNTYGPGNNHPASVSEALGPILNFLLGVGIAGFVALVLVVLYGLATLICPGRLRGRKNEGKALIIGLPTTMVTTIVLYSVIIRLD